MGIYSFAPSPILGPKPSPLRPVGSVDSLTPTPLRPKSILRRHRSDRGDGRPRSVSCCEPGSSNEKPEFGIVPPLVLDDSSMGSDLSSVNDRSLKRQQSFVHFDPTITVRECIGGDEERPKNWFSVDELRSFMVETVNVCRSSAVAAVENYSLPAVKDAYEKAHEVGVRRPVLSSTQPEYRDRALYADPCLQFTDEDSLVHDGSNKFFGIVARQMRRVLIVDNSPTALKLFRRHVLCMFPHVQVDVATSAEEALDKIEIDPKRACLNYDMMIVEERLQRGRSSDAEELDLTGSELLRLVNEMESSASSDGTNHIKQEGSRRAKPSRAPSRRSLKIGVSVSLGEDCESLRNEGGADLFWSKPPPKPSNSLRNQVINTLLGKRGKSVYICGC